MAHPHKTFTAAGFAATLYSPEGGPLHVDEYSDPYADNGYSADDDDSKRFLDDPATNSLLDDSRSIADLGLDDADVLFLVGGQGPMVTVLLPWLTGRLARWIYPTRTFTG